MAIPAITKDGNVNVITHLNGTVVRQHQLGHNTRASFSNSGPDVFWIRQGGLGANGSTVGLDAEELQALVAALRAEGLV